ncbi:ABC transporter ATP-binding protein [Phytohabitans rumicis]|uniref:Sugar ABC transporter ATP-binding protein n=1 Tax=Phytohabitans rumicis TaxID=1076125 RepID=A0A6V8L5W4_9ACTN|nr:ABC transporter ATP-binding protein [Phytohabitans rumicis]GFJ89496.1 sugar ABC transporter ATP-binding protein [Phytohabitans rumicis]
MVAIAVDRLTKVFPDGTVAVDGVSFEAASGEFLVLLGPTGCGKSTILRLVAGLEQETSGHVLIDGRVVDEMSARDRKVAMVFQDYALYPHLTVAQNIGFPLRVGHHAVAGVDARVAKVAEHLGVTDLLHRLPGHLSGGQRQRVAMARAIVREPQAFLLDEPLSNLDAGLRAELRTDVAALARRLAVTTLYVTHDQTEAMTMADRVAVLRRGVLQQIGPPAEVYGDPATLFVAAFLGTPRTNLLQGAIYVDGDRAVIDLGSQVLELPSAGALAGHHNDRVTVAVRADALRPVAEADGPALRGSVRLVENLGHEALVHLDTGIVPTPLADSQLEHPDTHLVDAVGEDPPPGHPFRQALARMMPHGRTESQPATARTEYGFYPVYDPESSDQPPVLSDVVVRVPAPVLPRRGDSMTVAVELDKLLLFDRSGARIRFS